MSIRSLLITGATGFVGSHVTEAIAGRVPEIRALVRPKSPREYLDRYGLEPVLGSLDDAAGLRRAVEGVDVVIHMAAATRAGSEAEFERVNAHGTRTLVEAIKSTASPPQRIVYLSSLAAAGPARAGQPTGAATVPAPVTAYGRTKLAGERICAELNRACEVVVLRPPAVYGPRDRDLFEFFRLADRGLLVAFSGPLRQLQLVHASDLARAVVIAATADRALGVYHIAEPRAYLWAQVGSLLSKAVGRRTRLVTIPAALLMAGATVSELVGKVRGKPSIFSRDKARELLAPAWLCETESARNALGFQAEIALEQGLNETATWYREHGWLKGPRLDGGRE